MSFERLIGLGFCGFRDSPRCCGRHSEIICRNPHQIVWMYIKMSDHDVHNLLIVGNFAFIFYCRLLRDTSLSKSVPYSLEHCQGISLPLVTSSDAVISQKSASHFLVASRFGLIKNNLLLLVGSERHVTWVMWIFQRKWIGNLWINSARIKFACLRNAGSALAHFSNCIKSSPYKMAHSCRLFEIKWQTIGLLYL